MSQKGYPNSDAKLEITFTYKSKEKKTPRLSITNSGVSATQTAQQTKVWQKFSFIFSPINAMNFPEGKHSVQTNGISFCQNI